jgi:holo-[acyl-carrier protein] synthase
MVKTTKYQSKKTASQSKISSSKLSRNYSPVNGLGFYALSLMDFKLIMDQTGKLNTLFTSEELSYCNNRLHSLAGRYAAKVAVRKALKRKIPWTEISISPSETRQPCMKFLGSNSAVHEKKGFQNISVSITHDEDIAAAFAACFENRSVSGSNYSIQIGIDITYVDRIAKLVSNKPEAWLSHIATAKERDESYNDIQKIVEIWSGKEAVSKALGTGIGHGVTLKNIEIVNRDNQACVRLTGAALLRAREKDLHYWKISFMRFPELTFAFVVASSFDQIHTDKIMRQILHKGFEAIEVNRLGTDNEYTSENITKSKV